MAAKDMEEYLPGVPLDATIVEATEDGFDVLTSDGVTSLVHVVVERQHRQPLQPGDPVVATVDGVGLEGNLLREGRPGEWVVRARTGIDKQSVQEITVPASDVAFSWRVGREMWMKAVRLAPLRLAARKADWLGIGSLEPEIYGSPRALSAGDPAALWGLTDEPELNGQVRGHESSVSSPPSLTSASDVLLTLSAPLLAIQGVTLVEKLGSSDGRWRVRLERLGDGKTPVEREMSAAAIGALPNWPFLGVSVACLRAFARAHEALLVDATTEDVCERVCKPLTETAGDSLAACLVRLGAADPVTGVTYAAAPTIFVSHARKYLFRDLLDTVCAHVSSLPEEEHGRHYVWLDIFSQYQHWIGDVGTAQRPCNWDVVFQLTTAAIGHTCLVFAPWRDAVPLRRAWMLWEVLCTLTAQKGKGTASSALRVRLPPSESDDFEAVLLNEFHVIEASVSRIDSRSAECFTLEDQAMVHAAIDRTLKGGHTELDALLSEALREWLATEGRAALARKSHEERGAELEHQIQLGKLLVEQGKHKEAEQLLREALKMSRATLGDWHPRSLKCINPLGSVLQTQGKYKDAEVLYREALKVCQKTVSDRHLHTQSTLVATGIVYAATTTSLGTLLKRKGQFQEAASLLRGGLEACRATFGSRDIVTLDMAKSLGTVLQDQGKLEDAEVLLREVLEGRRAMLGHRHTETIRAMNDLGLLLGTSQGKFEEAAPLLRGALEALRVTLGDRHQDTQATMNNLGELLMNQGKLDEAAPLLREVLKLNRATLGNRHRQTLISICCMGKLLHRQGKIDEAEVLFREDLEGSRATLGNRHPDTLVSIQNLAGLLFSQNKLKDALPLFLEVVEGRRATLGDRHPSTISSVMHLEMLSSKLGLLHEPLLSKLEPKSAAASSSPITSPNPSAGGLVGEQVLVHGLVAKPELNSRTGIANAWDSERGRYSVRLQDGSLLSLKPANLKQLDTALVRPTTADEEERMLEEALAASMQGLTATAKEPIDDEEAEMAAALALSMQRLP